MSQIVVPEDHFQMYRVDGQILGDQEVVLKFKATDGRLITCHCRPQQAFVLEGMWKKVCDALRSNRLGLKVGHNLFRPEAK